MGLGPPLGKNIKLGRTELGDLAEKKLSVWQKKIGKLKSAETEHGQHSPFPPYFANFSAKFVCFQPFLPILCLFLSHLSAIFAQC